MTDAKIPLSKPADDVICWLEHDASIMLKAVTRFGDPVELTADEARALAASLTELADQLEPRPDLASEA